MCDFQPNDQFMFVLSRSEERLIKQMAWTAGSFRICHIHILCTCRPMHTELLMMINA